MIRVIVKEPGRPGKEVMVPNDITSFWKLVGGYIEVHAYNEDTLIVMNEEGKLRELAPNFFWGGDLIVGPVVFVGTDGEDFADCQLTMEAYREQIEKNIWGL